jgi:hypothetical protein
MKKLLFLCILAVSCFATAAIPDSSSKGSSLLELPDVGEEATYTELDHILQKPLLVRRVRQGDVTRVFLKKQLIITVTQTKDGRETTWERAGEFMTTKRVFPLPIFDLPHGSKVWGTEYQQMKGDKGGTRKIGEQKVVVQVEKTGPFSTYSYLYIYPPGNKLEKVTYTKNSLLPQRIETVVTVMKEGEALGIIAHRTIIRTSPTPE